MNSGAVFNNQAGSTIDVQSPLSILSEVPANGTTPVFTNAGTFRQTVTTGTTTFGTVTSYTPAVAFNNSGTVDVQTGTLSLQGGGTIAAGAAFTGAGFTRFAGGPGLQTMTINGAATGANLALDAGILTGPGDLTVSGEFDWTGGGLAGTGRLILAAGAQMNLTGASYTMTGGGRPVDSTAAGAAVNWTGGTLGGTLNVQGPFNLVGSAAKTLTGTVNLSGPGTSVWGGTGALDMNSGAVFNNQAGSTIDVQSPLSILSEVPANGTTPVFTNAGTFRQTVTTGTTTFGTVTSYTPAVAFNNSGTVDVQTGTLSLQGGGTIAAGAAFTGAGFTRFAGGPGLQTMTINGAATGANLAIDAGILTGPGDLTVSGEFDWTGGGLAGTGRLILAAGAQMNLTGASYTMTGGGRPVDSTAAGAAVNWTGGTLGGTLNVQGPFNLVGSAAKTLTGTVNLSGPGTSVWGGTGALDMNSGAVFNNQAGSTIDVQSPLSILSEVPANGTTPVFTNAGTFRQTVTTGTTTFGTVTSYTPAVAFNNSGTVDVQTGTLSFLGGFSNSGDVIIAGADRGPWLHSDRRQYDSCGRHARAHIVNLDGGALSGSGSVVANVDNTAGQVDPGAAETAGVIAITGTYTQGASGALNIDIGGTRSGQFDRLTVSGPVTLDGTLNVGLINGFTPSIGEEFVIVTSSGVSGTFVDNTIQVGNVTFTVVYSPSDHSNDVVLTTAQASPAISTSQQPASATVGTSIADMATVSGGDSPTGTVTFNLYNNSTATGTPLFTDTETLSGGMATSASYPTTATGTDYWVATYNGDSTTMWSAAAPHPSRCPSPWRPHRSTLTSSRPPPPSAPRSPTWPRSAAGTTRPATVTFNLYSNSTASGTPLFTDTETLSGGMATSASYTTTATGTDYWVATYNGDSNNASVTSGTASEPVTITLVTPSINTYQQPATATVGTSIADKATVSGGYNPTGTVTFNLYSNSTASGTPLFTDTEALSGGMATSASYPTTATGTDYWVATYNGDSNNASVTSGTAAEPVTITLATPIDQHLPAAGHRHRRHLDRRQGHGQRRVQPDRHRHLQPLQQLDRERHAPVHRHRGALRRHGHLGELPHDRDGHRLLGRHLQR